MTSRQSIIHVLEKTVSSGKFSAWFIFYSTSFSCMDTFWLVNKFCVHRTRCNTSCSERTGWLCGTYKSGKYKFCLMKLKHVKYVIAIYPLVICRENIYKLYQLYWVIGRHVQLLLVKQLDFSSNCCWQAKTIRLKMNIRSAGHPSQFPLATASKTVS